MPVRRIPAGAPRSSARDEKDSRNAWASEFVQNPLILERILALHEDDLSRGYLNTDCGSQRSKYSNAVSNRALPDFL